MGSGREKGLSFSLLDPAHRWPCLSLILLIADPACHWSCSSLALLVGFRLPASIIQVTILVSVLILFPIFFNSFRLGCPNFTFPNFEPTPVGGTSCSLFFPDQAIYQGHPRFRYVTVHVQCVPPHFKLLRVKYLCQVFYVGSKINCRPKYHADNITPFVVHQALNHNMIHVI